MWLKRDKPGAVKAL
jgi:hypothetical protein